LVFLLSSLLLVSAAPPPPGSQIPVNGTASWLLGVNYPWNDYGRDIGTNSWGYDGVASTAATTKVTQQFQQLHNARARVVRWFAFADGRAGITFDSSGRPTGVDNYVFNDIQAAIQIARQNKLFLCLSLFDFEYLLKANTVNGVQCGGHTDTLIDATKLNALINNVVIPVLRRFGNASEILAWEIMNEPEWIISDLPQSSVNSQAVPVNTQQFWNFASAISKAVHTYAKQYVTIGSACLKWYRCWTPTWSKQKSLPTLDLDFYQTHYYSWMDPYCETNDPDLGTVCFNPLQQAVTPLALDRPIVIGEFDASSNLLSHLNTILSNGYAGAWPWSLNSDFGVDWNTYTSWATSHQNIIHW